MANRVLTGLKAAAIYFEKFGKGAPGEFLVRYFEADKSWQLFTREAMPSSIYVENEPKYNGAWWIIDRNPPEVHGTSNNPPRRAGPFDTVEAACAAYLIVMEAEK